MTRPVQTCAIKARRSRRLSVALVVVALAPVIAAPAIAGASWTEQEPVGPRTELKALLTRADRSTELAFTAPTTGVGRADPIARTRRPGSALGAALRSNAGPQSRRR